ncbi:RDD family protein [Streptomyces sioyaensis]|uniref:RDD family protein n=1 Tax=Streptomyces sioyaensis TaxID=67364 RepID=UPI001F1662BD|nr:RDD family protein [Streptomyces sioyaensis]MCF3174070.1 RDD family protein [Streptomyces sioyaensis]
MSELVTGEAVVLGLRPARLPSRGLAVAVDVAVAWVSYIGISLMLVSATSSMDSAAVAAVSVASFLLVQVGIPIVVETLSQGRSLGKVICGLRVVREDGGPIRFRHALVRGAMGAIEIVLTMGVVAAIASLVSARGRRLGDVFAGTLVIRERMPVAQAGTALPPPPAWLVAELGALDLSRVPDGWWLTVRQYLARMGQLDPQAGGAMAGRLAEDLRGFTGVPGPAGVYPAAYLAAVVGERQARESQRAFGGSGVAGVSEVAGMAGAVRVERGEGAVVGPWDSATSPQVGVVGDVEAAASVGAWAPPGGGAGAPGPASASAADEGPMSRGLGGGPVGVPGREPGGGGHDGGAAGGRERASRTGFAPPV